MKGVSKSKYFYIQQSLKRVLTNIFFRIKGGHYVATHGRLTPDPPYVHSNRGYSTDGEESHRAPSERTMSEYTIAHERTSPQGHYHSSRKTRLNGHSNGTSNGHYSQSVVDSGGPRSLNGPPPTRLPPRAPSALSYDHGGDAGSDIYVTSAAYKAPSEIRYFFLNFCKTRN